MYVVIETSTEPPTPEDLQRARVAIIRLIFHALDRGRELEATTNQIEDLIDGSIEIDQATEESEVGNDTNDDIDEEE